MEQDYHGVYLPGETADTYHSTHLANAGWYEEGQHGGAFSALVVGHVEQRVPALADMQVSRVTVELFRVIPLTTLRIDTEVVREGKRIQCLRANVHQEGQLLSTITVERLRVVDLPVPGEAQPPPPPFAGPASFDDVAGATWGVGERGRTMFHRNAMDVREVEGGFSSLGPGTVWMRLAKPIVAGRETTPLQRLVATADFCNGISRALDHKTWVFLNPDLTVHVARYPEGEWIGLSAESVYGPLGRGVATGSLWDSTGWLGRSTQSLYLDRVG